MGSKKHGPYEFLGVVIVCLMNTDKLIGYSFLEKELRISRTYLSAMRKGKDMYLRYYVRTIQFIMEQIHLVIVVAVLVKQLRKALDQHYDLVIAAVPHHRRKDLRPEDVDVMAEWDGV